MPEVNAIFDGLYAATYDVVYEQKDYSAEVDAVLRLMREEGGAQMRSILDLGCGTGRHAVELAQRGLRVMGIDRSEHMLVEARRRALACPVAPEFSCADLRGFDLGRTYDAAMMMFNVIGYIVDNDGLLATLRAIRRHLDAGSPFVFDFWYGPGVVADPPKDRLKEFMAGDRMIRRATTTTHHPDQQRCDIDIRVEISGKDEGIGERTERHAVRYFFPLEIDLALRASGFKLAALRRFPRIDQAPQLDDWNVIAIATAVDSASENAGVAGGSARS